MPLFLYVCRSSQSFIFSRLTSPKIVRLHPFLPLDIASDAGDLLFRNLQTFQNKVRSLPEILSCYRLAIFRRTRIKTAAISQLQFLIEEIKIRGTGSPVTSGDLL